MLLQAWLPAIILALQVEAKPFVLPRALPVTPSNDPFYTPPAGFEDQPPGTVLRNRSIDASFLGLVPDPVEGQQLLYRTTAIDGSAIATVTTVFKPANAQLDRFVSFQTAYDSADNICDPSYTYQLGAQQTDFITSFEMLLLQAYIASGYIVSSSDYEGPEAAFSAGRLAGKAVLDNMRAVYNSGASLGFSNPTPMVVGVGYSGGAIATGWAASLQHTYAPELNIKGWASGGTPANLTGTLVYLDGTVFSGFLPDALEGQLKPSAYKAQLQSLFNHIATPFGRSKINYAAKHCATDDIMNFADQSVLSTQFQSLGYDLLYNKKAAAVLKQNLMGKHKNEVPVAPVYLYHATQDEIIPYSNASTLASSWCAQGATIHFTTFGNGGHLTTEILGLPGALEFTSAAFAGSLSGACSQDTVLNNTLDPLALGVSLEPIAIKLLDALAIAGPDDQNIISNIQLLKKTI